jgi:hypothetical protein
MSLRSSKADKHGALWQAGTITALALAMTAFGIAGVHRPASVDQLRVPIEELHSDAAELAFLRAERSAGRVSDSFYDAHLRHLARTQGDSYRELTRLQVRPALMPLKMQAVGDGQELGRHLTMLREGEDVDDSALQRVRDRLDVLARDLRG